MKKMPCRTGGSRHIQPRRLTTVAAAIILGAMTIAAPYVLASKDKRGKDKLADSSHGKLLPTGDLTEDEAILHALNRLGFGPRPGDLDRIKELGLEKWLVEQLHPQSIDDSALDARLEKFPTLKMSSAELIEQFPPPQLAARREGITVEEYRKQQQEQVRAAVQQSADQMQAADTAVQKADPTGMPDFEGDMNSGTGAANAKGQGKGQAEFSNKMFDYTAIHLPQRIVAELAMAKMTRAVYSERQLEEQMVNFWYNHFNVYAAKGADRWLITDYEQNAIRPHALGKFRDLLEATAKSPAMLFFLDNWLSVDPVAWQKLQQEQAMRREMRMRRFAPFGTPPFPDAPSQADGNAAPKQERGLNENYGRELMELHTLGVDGGYTQDDVINVARAFTGWTIKEPRHHPEFVFNDRLHDSGVKMVLGHKIHAGGMRDGEEVLDLLARDPHTAHHICYELAEYFVSDNPPAALVDRMADTFLKTDGDIREVLHTMIYSPEFWSRDNLHAKVKTPFELVASAARAVNADIQVPLALVQWTNRIGEPLYQCEPPTGYADKADAWVNTGALLNRMNFSLALTANRLRGVRVNIDSVVGAGTTADPEAALQSAIQVLLGDSASDQTRNTLEKQMKDPQILQATLDDKVKQVNVPIIAGLVLGSPEFQRR